MISIKEQTKEFNKVERYLLTVSQNMEMINKLDDGFKIPVAGYMVFEDIDDNTGETSEIMSIITPDNKIYACQSDTFKRAVRDIQNIMEGQTYTIIKTSGTTKNGRTYINCMLDVESVDVNSTTDSNS